MKSNHVDSKINITKNAMNRNFVRLIIMAVFALNGATLLGQQQAPLVTPSTPSQTTANAAQLIASEDSGGTQAGQALAPPPTTPAAGARAGPGAKPPPPGAGAPTPRARPPP